MGSIPGLAQWVIGSSIAATAAQSQPLALELPHAVGYCHLKKKKKRFIQEKVSIPPCFLPASLRHLCLPQGQLLVLIFLPLFLLTVAHTHIHIPTHV